MALLEKDYEDGARFISSNLNCYMVQICAHILVLLNACCFRKKWLEALLQCFDAIFAFYVIIFALGNFFTVYNEEFEKSPAYK